MENYLAMIRRADFIDLFKFGSLHVNKDLTRQFTCPVESLPEMDAIFRDLTCYANVFESSFSYLFIHYTKNLGRCNDIHISEVKHIYPLDYEAKKELSHAFDPRIQIEDPLWPNAVLELQKEHSMQGCKNGAINIWKIYGMDVSIEDIENSYITSTVLKEVVDELYANRHPKGDLPIWVYAMRYERHAFYPANTIGCFMDAIHVIFNFMQKQELEAEAIEHTNIMQFLQHLNNSLDKVQFNIILEELSKEKSVGTILEKAKEFEPTIDLIKCLTLFFIYRNRYREEFRYEEEWAKTGKQNGKEFSIAAFMLGCILQHDHTYDCLYEHLPLDIFKKKEAPKKGRKTKQTEVLIESKLNKKEQERIEEIPLALPKEDTQQISSFTGTLFEPEGTPLPEPIVMKKSPNARKGIVTVKTEEEYRAYLDKGYKCYPENIKTKKRNSKK